MSRPSSRWRLLHKRALDLTLGVWNNDPYRAEFGFPPLQDIDMGDANFKVDGHKIRVLSGPYLNKGKPTPEAREFAVTLIGWLDKIRTFAAKRYRRVYNDTWREEGDPILNNAAFCARPIDPSIVLYDEIGAATVYFGDSDMFCGHSIEVSIHEGKIADASMVG